MFTRLVIFSAFLLMITLYGTISHAQLLGMNGCEVVTCAPGHRCVPSEPPGSSSCIPISGFHIDQQPETGTLPAWFAPACDPFIAKPDWVQKICQEYEQSVWGRGVE